MEASSRTVESYIAPNDAGLIGHCRDVGDGITELKIDFGPGYRVYCVDDGVKVLLLCGGTKRTQDADIARAKRHWREYRS